MEEPAAKNPVASTWGGIKTLPRLVLRGLALALVMVAGLAVSALFQLLRVHRHWHSEIQQRAASGWGRALCWLFGMRVRRIGQPGPEPLLMVANHLGWVDVIVILACVPARFVSKAEVRQWPLVGWLAGSVGTLFHQRGDSTSLGGVREAIKTCLRGGGMVAIFPEGRSGDGLGLGPFHARLFQAAIDSGVAVQPLALCYRGDGGNVEVCFQPRESFAANFFRLLGRPPRVVEVHFGEPFNSDGQRRRALAERARGYVAGVQAEHGE